MKQASSWKKQRKKFIMIISMEMIFITNIIMAMMYRCHVDKVKTKLRGTEPEVLGTEITFPNCNGHEWPG